MKESEIAAFERAAGLCAFVRSTWNSAAPNRGTLHASIEPAAHVIDNSGSVLRRLLSCGACVRDAEVVTMCDVVISLGILLCEEISKMPITVPFDGLIKALDKYVTLRFHVSRDFWRAKVRIAFARTRLVSNNAKHADKKRIEALQQKWHPLYFAVGALGTAPIPVASAGCAPRCAGREMDLDLIREVARALVFVPGKSADSWTPTICANRNARPDEIIKVDVSPLPSAATGFFPD